MNKQVKIRPVIRYSEAFKLEVVRELERDGMPFDQVRRKYGILGNWTVQKWVHKYGNGSRGKVIRVEKPEEVNEKEQLKRRVRALERALADTNIDLALERQYTRLACERAGIRDVGEFKKKAGGQPPMEP
jgi:transposase-like protein